MQAEKPEVVIKKVSTLEKSLFRVAKKIIKENNLEAEFISRIETITKYNQVGD